jgi:hypothetical protein
VENLNNGESGQPSPDVGQASLPVRSSRDRHGRGVRRPLWSPRFEPGLARRRNFNDTVQDAVGYLRANFPDEFAQLQAEVRDLPSTTADSVSANGRMRRYAFNRETHTVIVYRIPIKYLGRAEDAIEELMRIESYVIEAAAEMIGRDPRDFFGVGE